MLWHRLTHRTCQPRPVTRRFPTELSDVTPNPTLTKAIDKVSSGEDLSSDEASGVLREIMGGNASEAQTAAFLIALRAKGETVGEIAGLARTMRELALKVEVDGDLVDTAGTGGGRPTFNVSTTAAFVAAGAGCRVAKHGNRSATSQCGSADVLEALGASIEPEPGAVGRCIEDVGFGFMFAPRHHRAMKHVVPVRKELGVRTIFNFLGPLTNPAGATRQVIGVSDGGYLETIAAALAELGTESALVVSSADGLDELSVSEATRVVELKGGRLDAYEIDPEEVGIERVEDGAVGAGTPEQNAEVLRGVLAGGGGTERALAVLNAGAAIYVGGGADTIEAGVRRAEDAIDSGAAREVMEHYVERSRELA
jgi:anthranilate phosphoribosyltransferase